MPNHCRPPRPKYIQFKIEASRCDLRVGDWVSPDTVVCMGPNPDETVTAGCNGQVVAVSFKGGEHALIVVIKTICP
jgi:hypothetical protein